MKIIVDGRVNNSRFLKNNFQRNYTYIEHNDMGLTDGLDITTLN